jgi:dihydrofolate reductase
MLFPSEVDVSKLRLKISMSLDGFVAGPDQSVANPPFHHPVFVLTHHPRPPLELEGGTTFTFVTDGIEAALERAREAAGGRDVSLAGGAKAAQQYLAAGLVDEMEINLVPALLGRGERLFDGAGDDLRGLELLRTVATPRVVHLKFARR